MLNVLSLFNGMSCGAMALDALSKDYNYFYSEIDKYANKATELLYPNATPLGDVNHWGFWDHIYNLPKIDLLFAGSPCQGFSIAGKRLNFKDPRSKLFFQFVNILKAYQPKYWLLENVAKMDKSVASEISRILGVKPIRINSALVSAQNRDRLYWTNIKGVEQPTDKGITTNSIIDFSDLSTNKPGWLKWWDKNANFQLKKKYSAIMNSQDKAITMTARQVSNYNGNLVRNKNGLRFLNVTEAMRLQTIPEITIAKILNTGISNSQLYKMVGNGWTVDVISHILSYADFKKG